MRRFILQHYAEVERATSLLGAFFIGGAVFANSANAALLCWTLMAAAAAVKIYLHGLTEKAEAG
jgi:hypothetical protein